MLASTLLLPFSPFQKIDNGVKAFVITFPSREGLFSQITTLPGLVMNTVNQFCADILQVYFLSH